MDDLDPWERQYLEGLPHAAVLPWSDERAFAAFPQWRWIYDKLELSAFSRAPAIDLEERKPDRYPVIVKPRFNLVGMGVGARVCSRHSALPKSDLQGFIAQELFEGDHITTDFLVEDGEVVAYWSMLAEKDERGSFVSFESVRGCEGAAVLLCGRLRGYSGLVNVESIGGDVIEAHLRGSAQYFDICGGLLEAAPGFVKFGIRPEIAWEKTFSVVYRRRKDCSAVADRAAIAELRDGAAGVRSVQLCFVDGSRLSEYDQDEQSFRYMVINGTSLEAIEMLAPEIHRHLRFE